MPPVTSGWKVTPCDTGRNVKDWSDWAASQHDFVGVLIYVPWNADPAVLLATPVPWVVGLMSPQPIEKPVFAVMAEKVSVFHFVFSRSRDHLCFLNTNCHPYLPHV